MSPRACWLGASAVRDGYGGALGSSVGHAQSIRFEPGTTGQQESGDRRGAMRSAHKAYDLKLSGYVPPFV